MRVAARSAQAFELHLDVSGPEDVVRRTLGSHAVTTWKSFSPFEHRVVTRADDQAAVDLLIDALRNRGISIVGLSRRRVSLEDAYLEIVAEVVPD